MILAFFIHLSFSTEHLTEGTNFMFIDFAFLDYIVSQLYLFLSIIFIFHVTLETLWVTFWSGYAILIIIEQKLVHYDIESCDAKGVFWEYFFFLNKLESLFCVSTEALSHKIRMQIVTFASDRRSRNNPMLHNKQIGTLPANEWIFHGNVDQISWLLSRLWLYYNL